MKKIRLLSAALALVAAPSCAFAGNILSIGIGAAPNDGTGDPLRTTQTKIMTAVNGLGNCFSGTLPPSSLMTFQCWWDTSAAPATLRYLDGTQWVAAGTLNQTTHVFSAQGGMTVGGDLTGTLPNPVVGPGAITSSKLAAGAAAVNVGSLGGDVSGTLPGSVSIGLNKVTFAKMAQVPAQTIACNPSGVVNNMSACAVSASISLAGTTLTTAPLTGDVTSSAGSLATTIAANVVTNAKAAQMATKTIKGNATGATANAVDLTPGQVGSMLCPSQRRVINTTSGSTGTYTTPTCAADGSLPNVIEVEFVAAGGGGGGGAGTSNDGGNGGAGAVSSFGSSLFSATGGSGGTKSNSAAVAVPGGAGGIGSGCTENLSGGPGASAVGSAAAGDLVGGDGGVGLKYPIIAHSQQGAAGAVGLYGGGGSGAGGVLTTSGAGGGGGGGGYCHGFITTGIATSYSFVQGVGGSAGAAGAGGIVGGKGGDGYIIIIARWQS